MFVKKTLDEILENQDRKGIYKMFMEFMKSNGPVRYFFDPSVSYTSCCNIMDFPEVDFNSDVEPIFHMVQLVTSLDLLRDEFELTEKTEAEIKNKYWVEDESDQIVIGKITITEFPNEWKEEMGVTWSYWLDALDGDHAVIGNRADEILRRNLYDDPFDFGSLFYIQQLKVHPIFRGEKIGLNLIRFTFKNLFRSSNGVVFTIAQSPITENIQKKSSSNRFTKLVDYYEKIGFTRAFNSFNKDDEVMEVELYKLQEK